MAHTLQFVDKIDALPTVRLDLSDGTTWKVLTKPAPDFSTPPLKKVRVATLMEDGDYIPASTYANRRLKFSVRVEAASEAALGTEIQKLNRELDRTENILKFQRTGASPVFFRTFRSPQYRLHDNQPQQVLEVDLDIEADSHALGLRVTQGAVVVNNDPSHATNPMFFDVTGVTGDVPAPAFLRVDAALVGSSDVTSLFAVRRHGTPGGFYRLPAESMVGGMNTTLQVNDPLMCGAGSNYMRTTFTTATMQTRLTQLAFPASGDSPEWRGAYRVMARLRKTVAGDAINIRMRFQGATGPVTPVVATPNTTNLHWLDLGMIKLPLVTDDPVTEGESNVIQPIDDVVMEFQAERASGTGFLDWDEILIVPADEEFCTVRYPSTSSYELILDGPRDKVYRRLDTGNLPIAPDVTRVIERAGDIINLAPNQTNRLVVMPFVGTVISDDKTWSMSVVVSFWPRFLYIRP